MIYALISALCWAGFDLCRKQLAQSFSAPKMSIMFSSLVLPIFLVLWIFSGATLPTNDYYLSATVSGLLAAFGSVSFIRALALGKMAIVLPMLSFTPVCSALLAWLWLKDPLNSIQIIAILGITLGSFWVLGGRLKTQEAGVWQGLLAACCWGCCIVLDKFALQYGPKEFHAIYITIIILFTIPTMLGVKIKFNILKKFPLWWLFATLCFSGAVIFQFMAIELLQPGVVEGLKRAVGILSALLVGMLFFKEQISVKQSAAIMLILISSVVLVY
ncbi:hypothetical protein PSECIP111854_03027 [Pseudoalteromonas sp. CIP111854]|uniref:EamA domain-containing protein n=1 Tax=Pseudoalteromonas holothuriae TaxID=2963714 RepID=A0A9W4R1H6_9GAMM|nr:DMT family transporter [Pseudoalteromonas sp. CIP111854]CAH9062509.1 hypothetical protein PSECIP111854_03027 [Pseudoalteromonas sp. CIP111854]